MKSEEIHYAQEDARIARLFFQAMGLGKKKLSKPMSVENQSPVVMKRRLFK